jgi:hypothetical protein
MEFENPYIVYVKTDPSGYITDVNSSAFLTETTGWVEIDRGKGDRFHHAQNNYFEKSIKTDGGAYRYRLVSGQDKKWRECTPEEIAEQEEANKPTPAPSGTLEERVTAVESDVADLTAAIQKGLSL